MSQQKKEKRKEHSDLLPQQTKRKTKNKTLRSDIVLTPTSSTKKTSEKKYSDLIFVSHSLPKNNTHIQCLYCTYSLKDGDRGGTQQKRLFLNTVALLINPLQENGTHMGTLYFFGKKTEKSEKITSNTVNGPVRVHCTSCKKNKAKRGKIHSCYRKEKEAEDTVPA